MKTTTIALAAVLWCAVGAPARAAEIDEAKRTVLGLYLTATEAYEKWKADPDGVKIIDVRTPEEYLFIGHPAMAWNVPLQFLAYELDPDTKKPVMKPNPRFLDEVKRIIEPDDTILVTCRSGQRSGPAVNVLAEAGFKNVYSVVDGFEGDMVRDPESVFRGRRMKNGWRNSGLPWTYEADPDRAYLPGLPAE
jgi:rhodanese-related sulfurtransferase